MAYYKQSSATVRVKPSAGKLFGIVISSTTSGTLKVYDSKESETTTGAVMINTITPSAGTAYNFFNGMNFNNGLYIVAANTIEFTVIYE